VNLSNFIKFYIVSLTKTIFIVSLMSFLSVQLVEERAFVFNCQQPVIQVTLVISPLIALMEDQLYSIRKRGIPAELLSMSTDQETINRVHKCLADPGFTIPLKLLYITPERMAKSKRFMSALQKCYQNKKLERVAIDEVHCCSLMGHDFRQDYKYLGTLKTLFPNAPIIGVTATASRKVLIDVQKILNIRGCTIFNSPFNGPNLFYGLL
jgi:ATP-dependent DNA helicase Q1